MINFEKRSVFWLNKFASLLKKYGMRKIMLMVDKYQFKCLHNEDSENYRRARAYFFMWKVYPF